MLILGSSSSSRLEVLKRLGINPEKVISPNLDETPLKNENPKNTSVRLAKAKGAALAKMHADAIIISADTIVCVGRRVIDKAATREDVLKAMELLSGRTHTVFTSVCVTQNNVQRTKTSQTKIKFKRLTQAEIAAFALTDEGIGKAGGYTINGFAESFIMAIIGSVSGVVGLPSMQTLNLLKSFKI